MSVDSEKENDSDSEDEETPKKVLVYYCGWFLTCFQNATCNFEVWLLAFLLFYLKAWERQEEVQWFSNKDSCARKEDKIRYSSKDRYIFLFHFFWLHVIFLRAIKLCVAFICFGHSIYVNHVVRLVFELNRFWCHASRNKCTIFIFAWFGGRYFDLQSPVSLPIELIKDPFSFPPTVLAWIFSSSFLCNVFQLYSAGTLFVLLCCYWICLLTRW